MREDAQILILGSFPSGASLAAQAYYAHPQNQFWRLVGESIDIPLVAMPYDARKAAMLKARIALWDIYAQCRRVGSLDAAIRDGAFNELDVLLGRMQNLRRVCFNGKTAGRMAAHMALRGYEVFVLPSSSPAYTLSFEKKLAAWREALVVPTP